MFPLKIIDKKLYILVKADIKKKYLKILIKTLSVDQEKKEDKILVDMFIELLTKEFYDEKSSLLKKIKRPIEVTNMFNSFVKEKSFKEITDSDKDLLTMLSNRK